MDVESTAQTSNQANSRAGNTVSHTGSNAGAGFINQNQAEATKVDEAPKDRWRLCTHCGVPGHQIESYLMVSCRRRYNVGHPPHDCPHVCTIPILQCHRQAYRQRLPCLPRENEWAVAHRNGLTCCNLAGAEEERAANCAAKGKPAQPKSSLSKTFSQC